MSIPSPPDEIVVLYQDEHVVAVAKPGGMPVHRSKEHARVRQVLVQTVRDQLGRRVNPIHRLDRPTSGVVLMAFESETTAAFVAALGAEETVKEYVALCRGVLAEGEIVLDRPLTNRTTGRVQSAYSEFERLERLALGGAFGEASLVRARIRTGRRHQIRRHLSHLRHPILVDSTYGKGAINRYCRETLGIPRLFLHARRVQLVHPMTGEQLVVEAPLPDDLAEPLGSLRRGMDRMIPTTEQDERVP